LLGGFTTTRGLRILLNNKAKHILVIACLTVILPTLVIHANAENYHTSSYNIEKFYDVSLKWPQLLGSKEWTTFKLWDDGFSTHCYVSFKFNTGLNLYIPANLRIRYPEVIEPGQQFNVETSLSLSNNKEVTFSTEFFVKLDLDIPVPLWIPGFGLTDKVKNVFGGSWNFKFDLNTQTIDMVLNTIYLGNDDVIQSFANYLGVKDFVTIENMNINSQTLGQLAFVTIRINFLKAVLVAAKTLTSLSPPFSAMVEALDWLLTNVITVGTGLKITPSLNAEIISPISSGSDLIFNTNNLIYAQDISTKRIGTTVNQLARESKNNNQITFNIGPLDYRVSFNSDWTYYLNVDVDFLNVDVYQNSWSCNLGTMPNLSTNVATVTREIGCSVKLDEPIHATAPQVNNGKISIQVNDNSGISNVRLVYSTDRISWERTNMIAQGETYVATLISSVKQYTTVYYYFEATDGDNDVYTIDNNGVYYSYLMEPEQPSFSDWINNLSDGALNLTIIMIAVLIAIIVITILLVMKKRKRAIFPKN